MFLKRDILLYICFLVVVHTSLGLQVTDRRKQKHIGICVTGQVRRVELESKIQYLVKPAITAGMDVYVALVLDPRADAQYVHRPEGMDIGNGFVIQDGKYTSMNQFPELFRDLHVPVVYDAYTPDDGVKIDKRYLDELLKSPEPGANTIEYATHRMLSHVRQWQTFNRCWELLGTSLSAPLDYVIRVRDDAVFSSPFVPSGTTPRLQVPDCMSYDGLNDRLAIAIGADTAKAYLSSQLIMMRDNFEQVVKLHQESNASHALHPEVILLHALTLSNVTVEKISRETLSFVNVRYAKHDGKAYTCFRADPDLSCLSDKDFSSHLKRLIHVKGDLCGTLQHGSFLAEE